MVQSEIVKQNKLTNLPDFFAKKIDLAIYGLYKLVSNYKYFISFLKSNLTYKFSMF